MKVLTLAVAAVAVASILSGCSGKEASLPTFYCPDGTALDLNTVDGHDQPAFVPVNHCPVKPSFDVKGIPTSLAVYSKAAITWDLNNGSFGTKGDPAHSMLSMLRVSPSSMTDAQLKGQGPAAFGTELTDLKREHQNLPEHFTGDLRFTTQGTYYLRGYMQVRAPGLENGTEVNVWGPESKLVVGPVNHTGKSHTVSHSAGGPTGKLDAGTEAYTIGDAAVFDNKDAIEHTFVVTGPAGCAVQDVKVASMKASDPIVLLCPGSWHVTVDETVPGQSLNVELTLREPQ